MGATVNDPTSGDFATYREVAGLVEKLRTELVAEIKTLSTHVDAKLSAHESEHARHEQRHDRDHDRRSNQIRWAVTAILTGLGVLAAIVIPIWRNP